MLRLEKRTSPCNPTRSITIVASWGTAAIVEVFTLVSKSSDERK
jgi:hypothetical protein